MGILERRPPRAWLASNLEFNEPIDREIRQIAAACLCRAIRDCLGDTFPHYSAKSGGVRERIITSARFWIESDEVDAFSFVWACAVLDLPPDKVRERIAKFSMLPEVGILRKQTLTQFKIAGATCGGRTRLEVFLRSFREPLDRDSE